MCLINGTLKLPLLRRLTDRLIPDDAVFLFIFKAWNPRIASYVRASTTQKRGKKTSSGGMRLFGNRLIFKQKKGVTSARLLAFAGYTQFLCRSRAYRVSLFMIVFCNVCSSYTTYRIDLISIHLLDFSFYGARIPDPWMSMFHIAYYAVCLRWCCFIDRIL